MDDTSKRLREIAGTWDPHDAHVEIEREAADKIDALRDAVTEIMEWIDNWNPSFVHDAEWPETVSRVRSAMGLTP